MAHYTAMTPELSAALLQICYILAVNANILADTGGPCTSADCTVRSMIIFPAFLQPVRNQYTACPTYQGSLEHLSMMCKLKLSPYKHTIEDPGLHGELPEVQVPLCCE